MLTVSVNGYAMPYISFGSGRPLVAIHGSLGDFRSWSPVMGPLSARHRLIIPSLRHFFPAHWDGQGPGFTIRQHTADVIAFIEGLGLGPVDLMGHSRGGHIAFRVAGARPDLVRRLVLAEPGGELDASLMPAGVPPMKERAQNVIDAARMIAAGQVDEGLELFVDRIDGPGTWAKRPASIKQRARDNAATLIGQINEDRKPFARADAEAVCAPTLLIGGAMTKGMLPIVLNTLAAAIPGARSAMIPNANHAMMELAPQGFSALVTEFLEA